MAGFNTTLQNNVNLQLGSVDFGPFLVDDDVTAFEIKLTGENFTNPAARLDITIEQSTDGGPFEIIGGVSGVGGAAVGPRGNRDLFTRITLRPGVNRRVQGTYVLSGQRLRTTVTVRAIV